MSPRFQCPQINFTGTQPHSFVCMWPVAKPSSSNRDLWPTEPRIFTIYLSYSKILLISEISFPPFFYAFFKTVKFSQMESDFFFSNERADIFSVECISYVLRTKPKVCLLCVCLNNQGLTLLETGFFWVDVSRLFVNRLASSSPCPCAHMMLLERCCRCLFPWILGWSSDSLRPVEYGSCDTLWLPGL